MTNDIHGDGYDDEGDGKHAEHEHQSVKRSDLRECCRNPGHDSSKNQVLKWS